MKRIVLFAWLSLALQNPNPLPGHGPWAGVEGVKCWRNATTEPQQPNAAGVKKFVHCECKQRCDEHGNPLEGTNCQTACGPRNDRGENTQCLCHADDNECEGHR